MRCILAVLVVAIFASNACCEEATLDEKNITLSMGSGMMRGHTTYQIGGHFKSPDGSGEVRFPLSELRFPLSLWFGSLGAKIELAEHAFLEAKIKKGISKDAGKMNDRDWGILYEEIDDWPYPDSLDFYSESDTEADVLTMDISARYYVSPWPNKTFSIFAGARYTLQKFKFLVSNLEQHYPSMEEYYGYRMEPDYVPGKVMEYKVTQKIPLLITGARVVNASGFGLDLMVGYSPFVKVEDEDRHLLRTMVSRAKCRGNGLLLSVFGYYKFGTRWSLNLAYDYMTIDTDGKEKQFFDGELSTLIDQKNFSDSHTFELTLEFIF